jgi:hypothetical protein
MSFVAVALLIATATRDANAQSPARRAAPSTDPRWLAWLGCWTSDSSAAASNLKCIVPAASANAVEEISVLNGRIVGRDRLDTSGRPHQIRQQGCDGSESVAWSGTGRRVYLRAEYVCATGIKGTSTRMFAFLPSGDWLEVENVQSGTGSIVHTERWRDAGVPANVPPEIASLVGSQRLAVTTARASAAAALTSDDVLDALHHTDAATVRAWIVATNQHFDLDGRQVAALVHSDVPASVLQAMLGAGAQEAQAGLAAQRSVASDEYLNTPVYRPDVEMQVVPFGYGSVPVAAGECAPWGCVGANAYSPYNGGAYYPYSPYSPFVPYPVFGGPRIIRRGRPSFGHPTASHGPPHASPHSQHSPPVHRGPVGRRP